MISPLKLNSIVFHSPFSQSATIMGISFGGVIGNCTPLGGKLQPALLCLRGKSRPQRLQVMSSTVVPCLINLLAIRKQALVMSIGMVAYLILHWQKLDKDCIYTRGPVVFVYVYMGTHEGIYECKGPPCTHSKLSEYVQLIPSMAYFHQFLLAILFILHTHWVKSWQPPSPKRNLLKTL